MTNDQDELRRVSGVLQALPSMTIEPDLEFGQSIFELLHVCGPNASEVFKRAIRIARNLNHKEVEISHVLLAMTLIPDGLGQLAKQNVSLDIVKKACWEELQSAEVLAQTAPAVAFSNEVMDVINEAKAKAGAQGEKQYTVRLGQLVEAIVSPPLNRKFARYFIGSVVKLTDVKDGVDAIRKDLDREFPRLERIERRIATVKHSCYAIIALASGVLTLLIASLTFSVRP